MSAQNFKIRGKAVHGGKSWGKGSPKSGDKLLVSLALLTMLIRHGTIDKKNSQLQRLTSQTNHYLNKILAQQSLQLQEMSVLLQTSFGDIVVDLYTDRAPNACLNFIKLCKIKHFNNSLVAEVQKNYVAYVRPLNPTTIWNQSGTRMPYFKDEIDVQQKVNELGLIATANSGPNLNNSEFFITLTKATITSLAGKHTVFGKVQEGLDVLRKINDTYSDSQNRPQMNIRILHTFVLDDPFDDLLNMTIPSRSPSPIKNSERLQAIQHLQMLQKCKSEKQIIEATREQKAKKQAMTLEILGDLPDSNLKPPENILFICKLNPITQEKDLQVIFSRFGPVKSVEIVRDWKTGQSLQYGFIQFQNITSCEQAYLKMNNVIIDDRRIQVDFSQSVSKLLHRNKGAGIVNSKGKYGQFEQKKRQLLPKAFTGGKDTREKYDLIIPNQQVARNKDSFHRQVQQRQYQNREKRGRQLQRRQARDNKPSQRIKKHKRSRSRSSEQRVSKKKQKHRSRSRSQQRRQKHREKKHKRDRSSS